MVQSGKAAHRILVGLALVVGGGALLGVLPSCKSVLTTFNPCGTIFAFCDPTDIDTMFADIPDYELDPTCSIPYYGIDHPDTAGTCSDTETYPHTPGTRPDP